MDDTGLRALLLLVTLVICPGCVSVPVGGPGADQIVAVGWSRAGDPVALAETDGNGATGDLVLLSESGRIGVDVPHGRLRVIRAVQVRDSDAFVVVGTMDDPESSRTEHRCLRVSFAGAVTSCLLPEALGDWRLAEDGGTIFGINLWQRRPYVFDLTSGELRALGIKLRELQVIARDGGYPDWLPCTDGPSLPRLSPSGTRIAFACEDRSVWVAGEDADPQRLLLPDPAPEQQYVSFGDHHTSTAFGTLVWASDESKLYYCPGPDQRGHVLFLDGRPPIPHEPCFLAGAWSPDSTEVAGDSDNELARWHAERTESPPSLE